MKINKKVSRIVIFFLLFSFVFFCDIYNARSALGLYLTLTTIASAVGGPTALVGILVGGGVLAGGAAMYGAIHALGTFMGLTVATVSTPWYTNPWTIGGVVIGGVGVSAALYYYFHKVTPENLRKSLYKALSEGKINQTQYNKAIEALNHN